MSGIWIYLLLGGSGLAGIIAVLVMRARAKKAGATQESLRREQAGRAAELELAKSDRKIAAEALEHRLQVRDTLRETLSREPTEAEIRKLIAESKE